MVGRSWLFGAVLDSIEQHKQSGSMGNGARTDAAIRKDTGDGRVPEPHAVGYHGRQTSNRHQRTDVASWQ